MLTALLPQTVVISTYSEGSQSPRGVPTATWTPQPPVQGRLQQTGGGEITDGQQTTIADWLLILPGGTAIGSKDKVAIDGQTFEVVGPPNRVYGATSEHHVEARLRSVT